MSTHPNPAKDILVQLVAFADGHDPKEIKVITNENASVTLQDDIALLRSTKSLGLKEYPKPTKAHAAPFDNPTTFQSRKVSLVAYNGRPNINLLHVHYPNTPHDKLYKGVRDLWIDRLSFGKGMSSTVFDPNGIRHRVSCYSGSSGGVLLDEKGHILGITHPSMSLTDRRALKRHLQIEPRRSKLDGHA